ncbi:MAG: LamG domain-containing protein [Sediminibacterium sp.]
MRIVLTILFFYIFSNISWSQTTLPQLQSLQYNDINFGNALNFNGTNTYGVGQVYVNDSIVDFTIEFWIKNTGADGSNDRIFSAYDNVGLHIAKSTTHLKLQISDLGGITGWQTPGILESNQWIHIALVKNATVLTVYKNANSIATYTVSATTQLPTLFRLGSNVDGIGENANFTIDELRIWNTVRTKTDIQKYMYANIDPNLNAALKLYYRFDQGDAGGANPLELGLYNSAIN